MQEVRDIRFDSSEVIKVEGEHYNFIEDEVVRLPRKLARKYVRDFGLAQYESGIYEIRHNESAILKKDKSSENDYDDLLSQSVDKVIKDIESESFSEDEIKEILEAERESKNRKTLIEQLEEMIN